jgi:hypothetical protein
MSGGAAITQPGKGSGGDINSLPMPKGNRSYAALKDLIYAASSMVGVDPRLMSVMAAIESGFDFNAKAGTSTASGLYQFIDGTWGDMLKKFGSKYGIDPRTRQTDPRANALLGGEYIKQNAAYLGAKLKRPLTDTDLYFAHFLGSGGAEKLLNANPEAIAANLLPAAAAANKSIFYSANGSPLTVGQVYALVNGRVKNKGKSFGISDGGEALVTSKPNAEPKTPGPTLAAAAVVAPVSAKATQNGIGAKAPSTSAASETSVVAASTSPAANDSPAINMAGTYGAFMSPQASNQNLAAQAKYQNEVKVLALDTTNKTLAESLDVQKKSLEALNSIAVHMGGITKSSNAPPAVQGAATSTPAGRSLRDGRQMAASPISLAKPGG